MCSDYLSIVSSSMCAFGKFQLARFRLRGVWFELLFKGKLTFMSALYPYIKVVWIE